MELQQASLIVCWCTSFLTRMVLSGPVKEEIHISGTCGNGLVCSSSSFHKVDCFSTLLSGRCTYSLGDEAFIAFMLTLSAAGLLIFICFLYFCCCPDWCHHQWQRRFVRRTRLREEFSLTDPTS